MPVSGDEILCRDAEISRRDTEISPKIADKIDGFTWELRHADATRIISMVWTGDGSDIYDRQLVAECRSSE
jgi:hypothetical protein